MTKFINTNGTSKKTNQEGKPPILPKRETFLDMMGFHGTIITTLIDTGAKECLIRKDIVRDKSEIKPSPKTTTKLFDGSVVTLLGYIKLIRSNDEVRFYVVEDLPYPMILRANKNHRGGAIVTTEVAGIGSVNASVDSGSNICVITT